MGLTKPIETVVIRELALRPREPAVSDQQPAVSGEEVSDQKSQVSDGGSLSLTSDLRSVTSVFTPERDREMDALLELLRCHVRRRILLSLTLRGAANVSALSTRTAIAVNTLSQHLHQLRTAGLVFSQRRGKEIWYEPIPERVRYQQDASGAFSLTLTARGSDVGVTITVGNGLAPAPDTR